MKIQKTKAFSLIELSVTIIVVAVMILAIIKSSEMLSVIRFKFAKNSVTSSEINSIDGLYLWYETTMDDSIEFVEGQANDEAKISSWKDVSHRSIIKKARSSNPTEINLNQANSALQPIYIKNSINGVPAIRFNSIIGTGDYLYSDSYDVNTDQFSFFMVIKRNRSGYEVGVLSGVPNSVNYDYESPSSFWMYEPGQAATTVNFMTRNIFGTITNPGIGVPYIVGFVYNGKTAKTYLNGEKVDEDAATGNIVIQKMFIAKRNYTGNPGPSSNGAYQGDIAEIIIYKKALKDNERSDVENYLSRKFKIKLTK